jgi:hypothetical protein
MADPSSFMVGPTPNYNPPGLSTIGMQLGQMLANLPEQYFQGQQRNRTLARQNAFPDGVPVKKDANGNPVLDQNGDPIPDTQAIVNAGFKLGGLDYAQGLLPFLRGQNISARSSDVDRQLDNFGDASAATARPSAHNPSAAGPANIYHPAIAPPQQSPNQYQPPQSQSVPQRSANPDAQPETVRNLTAEIAGFDRDVPSEVMERYATALGLRSDRAQEAADQPLSPQMELRARQMISNSLRKSPGGGPQSPGQGYPAIAPTSQSDAPPITSAGDINEAVLRAVAPLLPRGVPAQSYQGFVGALNRAIQGKGAAAEEAAYFGNAPMATQLQAQAKTYQDWRDRIFDAVKSAADPTGSMKEWYAGRQPGESQAAYEARRAGLKKGAEAPYEIATAAVREGGRPVTVKPNEVVTTGATVSPELQGITDWASRRLGIPTGAAAPASNPNGAAPPPSGQMPIVAPGAAASGQPAGASLPGSVQGQSAFTPRMIRNPDGSVTSSVTPGTEGLQKEAIANYSEAQKAYDSNQQTKLTLVEMEDSLRALNGAGWSSTGPGADARLQLARSWNTLWQVLGVDPKNLPFNPDTIGKGEDLNKNSTRLGFQLARSLGAREAAQIVQGAIKANPGDANTPTGARMVIDTIRQNAERNLDYFEFATRYAQTHGGDLLGADMEFNRINPPNLYARRAILQAEIDIPQEAIELLRQAPTPKKIEYFNRRYGADLPARQKPLAPNGLAKLFLPQGS